MDIGHRHLRLRRLLDRDSFCHRRVQREAAAHPATREEIRRIHIRRDFSEHTRAALLAAGGCVDERARGGQVQEHVDEVSGT